MKEAVALRVAWFAVRTWGNNFSIEGVVKKFIFEIPFLPPLCHALRRMTIGFVLSSLLVVPFAWAGLDEGVQAYKKKDYAKALIEFRALAERGNTDAQYNLGQMYRQGEGVPQDDAEAVRWYRLAAEKGDADAQYNLGQMYRQGIGVPQDAAEAVKWYRLAAKQGYANAQAKLKAMDIKESVPKNNAKVVKRTDLAVKKNDTHEQVKPHPVHGKDKGAPQGDAETTKRIRVAAEQGDAKAQLNLGLMYDLGQGVPQDFKEAVKWYRLAAEQGDAKAQFNLGVAYDQGRGVPKDYKEAVKWYRLSTEVSRKPIGKN